MENIGSLDFSDGPEIEWRKSSRSIPTNDCVEAAAIHRTVVFRDSKNPEGGTMALPVNEAQIFFGAVRDGMFDLPT